jgi:hypothetical protein
MRTGRLRAAALVLVALLGAVGAGSVYAARESKISATKHNLSKTGTGTTHSTTESQICVFCHTPHGADASQAAPLWNKTLANTTYTPYTSSSLDAATIQGASAGQPLGSSKLCLSCHDGVMALGSVRVLRGQQNVTIGGGTNVTMPVGSGTTTGYTRNLGTDLTNDHPVSVTFDATLSDRDGELRKPTMTTGNGGQSVNRWGTVFGVRMQNERPTYKPLLPLEPTGAASAGQVQCTTCHDPHIRETDLTAERNIKFLRANRFQKAQPTNTYSATNDIVCLACHDKGMQGAGGNTWAYSVHANSQVATQTYKTAAADTREFPTGIAVWKAACLNCHDTHTVQGSRRLLREGTDATPGTALYLGGFKAGGNAAMEETCYQCHTDTATSILNSASSNPPNVKQDFALTYRMRIRSADQPSGGSETHDVGGNFDDTYNNCTGTTNKCGADLIESRTQLGKDTHANRHVECADCHNPHRVVKFQQFYGSNGVISGTPDSLGTHKHTDASGYTHTNVASGALRGSWGVEPNYTCCSFHTSATGYTVRRGDPGTDYITNDSNADTKTYVTREYQVCMKCHSSYGFGSTAPTMDATNAKGLTASGTNGLTQYTDQAKEFQAPATHADEPLDLGNNGGSVGYNTKNHRSWHPVMRATGRTAAKRGVTATSAWNLPWSNAVGTQTMYCSDCHGSNVTSTSSVIPNTGNAWGPHGSANPFILKGTWTNNSSNSSTPICLKCHNPTSSSGFTGGGKGNLHQYHIDRVGKIECTWCHVAVPHGWKNRSLLVNLNDVGEEAGQGAGSSKEVKIGGSSNYYTQPPYYLEAKNKISSFATSGSWADTACGSASKSGTGLTTGAINSTDGGTSNTTGTGKNWMTSTCQSPP